MRFALIERYIKYRDRSRPSLSNKKGTVGSILLTQFTESYHCSSNIYSVPAKSGVLKKLVALIDCVLASRRSIYNHR